MLWISESKVKDLESLTWFTYSGDRNVAIGNDKQFNQKHPLVVQPGELVGLKRAMRGPGAGNYQIVLGRALHVLFRNVPQKQLDKIKDKLKPYKGKTPTRDQILPDRKRVQKVRIREKVESDKLKDDHYRPSGPMREQSSYNRENYQWRKCTAAGLRIKSAKQGRAKHTLQVDDVVGVRYMTKARGGFIILPDQQRVNITHDLYEELLDVTRILPSSRQQRGIVLMNDVKAGLPKQTRNRVKKEEIVPRGEIETKPKGIMRTAKKHGAIGKPDIHDADFDDDEEDDLDLDLEDTKPIDIPSAHSPSQLLRVGTIIQSSKRAANKFIVVSKEEKGNYTEFRVYHMENQGIRVFRLPNSADMTRYPSIHLQGEATKSELAGAIRALNKAVKTKTFTPGTIHD